MDAGSDLHSNGNGHADPSAALPSSTPPTNGQGAHAPEPLVVVDGPPRDSKGRILPGHSLNPKGKPKGIPNRNAELVRILNTTELREAWTLAKAQAKKGDSALMQFMLDRVLLKQTPEAAGLVLNVNQSNQETHNQTNVRIEQYDRLLGDGQGRDLLAALAQRAAACGAFSGDARHVRQ
jgi:hypothetical protein